MKKFILILVVSLILICIAYFTNFFPQISSFLILPSTEEKIEINNLEEALELLPLDRIFDIYILENNSVDLRGFSKYLKLSSNPDGRINADFSIIATSPAENFSLILIKTQAMDKFSKVFQNLKKEEGPGYSIYRNDNLSALLGKNFAIILSGNDSIILLPILSQYLEHGSNQSVFDFFPLFHFYYLLPKDIKNSSRTMFALSRGVLVNSLALTYSKSSSENATFLLMAGAENFLNLIKEQILQKAVILSSFKAHGFEELECYELSLEGGNQIICSGENLLIVISGDKELGVACLDEFEKIKVLP